MVTGGLYAQVPRLTRGNERDRDERARDPHVLQARQSLAEHERCEQDRCDGIEGGEYGGDRDGSTLEGNEQRHHCGDLEHRDQ